MILTCKRIPANTECLGMFQIELGTSKGHVLRNSIDWKIFSLLIPQKYHLIFPATSAKPSVEEKGFEMTDMKGELFAIKLCMWSHISIQQQRSWISSKIHARQDLLC